MFKPPRPAPFAMAHRVLPQDVFRRGETMWSALQGPDAQTYLHERWETEAGGDPADAEDLDVVDRLELGRVAIVLISFPAPEAGAEPHYAAIVRGREGGFRFFVMEKGVTQKGEAPRAFTSEWGADGSRVRGADLDDVSAAGFTAAVKSWLGPEALRPLAPPPPRSARPAVPAPAPVDAPSPPPAEVPVPPSVLAPAEAPPTPPAVMPVAPTAPGAPALAVAPAAVTMASAAPAPLVASATAASAASPAAIPAAMSPTAVAPGMAPAASVPPHPAVPASALTAPPTHHGYAAPSMAPVAYAPAGSRRSNRRGAAAIAGSVGALAVVGGLVWFAVAPGGGTDEKDADAAAAAIEDARDDARKMRTRAQARVEEVEQALEKCLQDEQSAIQSTLDRARAGSSLRRDDMVPARPDQLEGAVAYGSPSRFRPEAKPVEAERREDLLPQHPFVAPRATACPAEPEALVALRATLADRPRRHADADDHEAHEDALREKLEALEGVDTFAPAAAPTVLAVEDRCMPRRASRDRRDLFKYRCTTTLRWLSRDDGSLVAAVSATGEARPDSVPSGAKEAQAANAETKARARRAAKAELTPKLAAMAAGARAEAEAPAAPAKTTRVSQPSRRAKPGRRIY
ncbi:MAG: hypothetical protein AAF928_05515 [Myxococcota bacterium]